MLNVIPSKTAHIVSCRPDRHWHEDTEIFYKTIFTIGEYSFEASSVRNRTLRLDETMIFVVEGNDRINWDGEVIGSADLNVRGWLEDQGYTVIVDTGQITE